jgi:hypothetical protein
MKWLKKKKANLEAVEGLKSTDKRGSVRSVRRLIRKVLNVGLTPGFLGFAMFGFF